MLPFDMDGLDEIDHNLKKITNFVQVRLCIWKNC